MEQAFLARAISSMGDGVEDLIYYVRNSRPIHPDGFVSCIKSIHQTQDWSTRNTIMAHVETALRVHKYPSSFWAAMGGTELHRVLIGIPLEGGLCGEPKESFIGPENLVCYPRYIMIHRN